MTSAERRQRQLAPVKTGLYVKAESGLRLRSRKVRRLVAKMRDTLPWLEPADEPTCRAWAEMEILGARAFAELVLNGVTNDQGEPRRLLGEFRQLRQAQLAYERELGMTPLARANLGIERAREVDVAAQLQAFHAHADRADDASPPPGGLQNVSAGGTPETADGSISPTQRDPATS